MKNIFKTYTLLYAFLLVGGYSGVIWGSDKSQYQSPEHTSIIREDLKTASECEVFFQDYKNIQYITQQDLEELLPKAVRAELPQTVKVLLRYKTPTCGTLSYKNIELNAFQWALCLATEAIKKDGQKEYNRDTCFANDCDIIGTLLEERPRWACERLPHGFNNNLYYPIDLVDKALTQTPAHETNKLKKLRDIKKQINNASRKSCIMTVLNPLSFLALGAAAIWCWNWLFGKKI